VDLEFADGRGTQRARERRRRSYAKSKVAEQERVEDEKDAEVERIRGIVESVSPGCGEDTLYDAKISDKEGGWC
jgi:hypothetical protein